MGIARKARCVKGDALSRHLFRDSELESKKKSAPARFPGPEHSFDGDGASGRSGARIEVVEEADRYGLDQDLVCAFHDLVE